MLQPFNLIGRYSKLANKVCKLENVHRTDTPVLMTLFNLDGDIQAASEEKELKLIKHVITQEVDLEVYYLFNYKK